ncbi:hypothetical protein CIB48_g11915 [Xylaria polymorpha]|nr:hypothetical protein CIB48_g11915 [Xylaria polymorpha]
MANYYGDSSSPSQTILIHPSVVYKGKSWTEDLGRVIRVKRGNAAKNKTLKRGVKEVVKSLRKSPAAGPGNTSFPGVVVLAGDISPMDVISHIPVLCEDVNVPYIFVASRAELGAAGSTKRPTSVVMVTEKRIGGAKKGSADKIEEEAGEEDFADVYKDLVKLVEKEAKAQMKFVV